MPFGYLEFSRAKRRELRTCARAGAGGAGPGRVGDLGLGLGLSSGSLPGLVLFESGLKGYGNLLNWSFRARKGGNYVRARAAAGGAGAGAGPGRVRVLDLGLGLGLSSGSLPSLVLKGYGNLLNCPLRCQDLNRSANVANLLDYQWSRTCWTAKGCNSQLLSASVGQPTVVAVGSKGCILSLGSCWPKGLSP